MEIVNQIVMKKISEIKPYVRNPRKNDKTVNLLVEIIPRSASMCRLSSTATALLSKVTPDMLLPFGSAWRKYPAS